MLDHELGMVAVGLARKSIEAYLVGKNVINRSAASGPLSEERGVFVSLYTHPSGELRGCIGFPYPVMPLSEALVKAAIAAATQDPRFEPMTIEELDNVVVEVSILSRPEEIKYGNRRELPRLVRVGVDGLIIETPYGSGLLLPQVPVEYGWDAETYLTHLCLKAGLNPTYWLYGRMKLLRYTAQIFREREPGGGVVEVKLGV
ncbi:MAG: TIGR00296 family protein [Nitrososphaerota archaeon]